MRDVYEEDIRSALRAHRGNVSFVAHRFGVERSELFEYIRVRPSLYQIVLSFREELVDNAEYHLRTAVDKEQVWAIRLTIQTLAKHRQHGAKTPETAKLEQFQGNLGKVTIDEIAQVDEMFSRPTSSSRPLEPNAPEPDYCQQLDQIRDTVFNALLKFVGNLHSAAKELNVKKAQLADYLKRRPQLQSALNDKYEYLSDHAEYTLHDLIDSQEPWAIRFVLRTLGRSRGYSETPLNDLMTLSGGLLITRLSSFDLRLLERLRGLVEPKADTIGGKPVLAGSAAPAPNPPMAAPAPNPPMVAPAPNPPMVAPAPNPPMVAPALNPPTAAASESARPMVQPSAVETAPPVEKAILESKPDETHATAEAAAPAEPVKGAVDDTENTVPEWEEPLGPDPEPAPMSLDKLPVRIDTSGFTPEQIRELEIVAGRVFSKVRIREIFNPDWPDDHPIYREFDELAQQEAAKKGQRAPPDST